MKQGVTHPNPRKYFLTDIGQFIQTWRKNSKKHEVILMSDMNEYTGDMGELSEFCTTCDLVDTVALLNPDIETDPTYLYGSKRINYIFTTPALAEIAIKAGHHHFHQHIISDHKGVYLHF